MEHFTKIAHLSNIGSKFQFNFDGIVYLPTVAGHAAGFLLFGLRPAGIEFHCTRNPALFLQEAKTAGLSMHRHANRIQLAPEKTLRSWIGAAVALAPNEEQARNVYNMIVENLGPDSAHLKK